MITTFGTLGKPNVLFLCTGNSSRSIMAEAILRHYAADHFDAFSAGLEPKGINPYTVRVLVEKGIDMTGLYSKDVTEYLGRMNVAYLITVCANADDRCPTVFLGMRERLHWDLEDPAAFEGDDEEKLAKFREIRDQIDGLIRNWLVQHGVELAALQN
jgi:arsenate reductase (thioredoxin)